MEFLQPIKKKLQPKLFQNEGTGPGPSEAQKEDGGWQHVNSMGCLRGGAPPMLLKAELVMALTEEEEEEKKRKSFKTYSLALPSQFKITVIGIKTYKFTIRRMLWKIFSSQHTTTALRRGNSLRNVNFLFKIEGVLGKGGFGTVLSAVRKSDGAKVAIKEVFKDRVSALEENVPLEVVLLQQVTDVPGVIRLLDYFETEDRFYIVMERFNGQDLFDFISECGTLTEEVARKVFRQVVETVYRCKDSRVFHGDIKDENIMINLDNGLVKLIDFGSARHLHSSIYTKYGVIECTLHLSGSLPRGSMQRV